MGRGRQKAKQTKVARELKYFSPETDYERLQRELASNGHSDVARTPVAEEAVDEDVTDDDGDEDDDEYSGWGSGRR